MPLILEGIITTLSASGEVNIAPMGPHVETGMERLLLRPFRTSQTYRNLCGHGEGVFHVTDDVLLLARAAIGPVEPAPVLIAAGRVRGHILADTCRYYEFRVRTRDDAEDRSRIEVEVVAADRLRDFFGFNRAKHAVVEAAILATRAHFLPPVEIETEFGKLGIIVEKTGGRQEKEAFTLLREHMTRVIEARAPQQGGRGRAP
jgi:hypothetical protein